MDPYNRTARLGPAYVALFPILLLIVALFGDQQWPQQVAAVIVAAGIPVLLADVVRRLGKSNEARLIKAWGGQPTTQFLRHHPSDKNDRDTNKTLREERHKHVTRITGLVLPTAETESDVEDAHLELYDTAIALIRPFANENHLVAQENANYGFWRNIRALRHFLYATSATAFATSATLLALHLAGVYKTSLPWLIVDLITAVLWAAMTHWIITDEAVRKAANNYARAVLQSLPTLPDAPHA